MATAEAYDQWDDPGMAFTDEQCAQYDPKAVAAVRVNQLLDAVPLALRRSQLGDKPVWWRKVADKMVDVVTWYCVVAELPGIDREEVLELPTDESELRKLTVAARKLGEEREFLDGWHADVRTEMVQHVTLGRRCASSRKVSGWGKRERSLSNRVANAVTKELSAIGRLDDQLRSRTAKSKAEGDQ